MEWLPPWRSVAQDALQASAMERELKRELSLGHPLFGFDVTTLARRQDCDDVLFSLLDGTGRVALVHLTWRGMPEPFPSPYTTLFENLESWATDVMQRDAARWGCEDREEK